MAAVTQATATGGHFLTREEVMAQLEEYLSNLQAEVKGVEEHMAELRKNET